jgi:hypothetical protein
VNGKDVTATIEIARVANKVAAIRTQEQGRCVYQGTVAADDKAVRGTFICSWLPGAYTWSGTISE